MGRRKTIAVATAAALALAAGATALAAPAGGPLGMFEDHDQHRDEHARALGKKLGVEPARVSRALDEVQREHQEAREDEMAKALAERLDVSRTAAERALEKAFAATRPGLESRRVEVLPVPRRDEVPPEGGKRAKVVDHHADLAAAIAKELEKSAGEVERALKEIHTERIREHLAQAVEAGGLGAHQAKGIEKRAESGRGLGPPPGFHGPGGGFEGGPPPHGPDEGF